MTFDLTQNQICCKFHRIIINQFKIFNFIAMCKIRKFSNSNITKIIANQKIQNKFNYKVTTAVQTQTNLYGCKF